MPTPPNRPTTVTLTDGAGRVSCSCGHDLPVRDLTQPIRCPRCQRVWIVRVSLQRANQDRPDGEG